MSEVRRTDASETQAKRMAKPARSTSPLPEDGGARGGWRRNVQKRMVVNQGSLSRCWKERGRSQSPHSSEEASNDRGAKEDRKVEA
jgi:hypothetical protein